MIEPFQNTPNYSSHQVPNNFFNNFTANNPPFSPFNFNRQIPSSVKVCTWNASGLRYNLDRLVEWMQVESVDLAFVTETWFRSDRAVPRICQNFSATCSNLNIGASRGKNGISVIINPRSVTKFEIENMVKLNSDNDQGCYLLIQIADIKILTIYYPPSTLHPIDQWLDETLDKLSINTSENLIILGDFNARCTEWGDFMSNPIGHALRVWAIDRELDRLDPGPTPTFRSHRGSSIVDHIFCNIDTSECYVSEGMAELSTHRPVVATIHLDRDTVRLLPTRMRLCTENLRNEEIRESFKIRTDLIADEVTSLLRDLELNHENMQIREKQAQIDRIDCTFSKLMVRAARLECGEKRTGKNRVFFEPLQSDHLDLLYRRFETFPDPGTRQQIAKELDKLRRLKFEQFVDKCENLPLPDVMKLISSINRNRRKRDGLLKNDPQSILSYKNHFEKMNRNTLPHGNPIFRPLQNNEPSLEPPLYPFFNSECIYRFIKYVKRNKAPGNSQLSNDMLKASSEAIHIFLASFFRFLMKVQLVPASWKVALIVPVPKKGDLSKIENYRPISLTESLRKLFEHCLMSYLKTFIEPMAMTQGGFRCAHNTNDMILCLNEVLRTRKSPIPTVFLDIRAAYDSVDRRILWIRCRERGIPESAIRILKGLFDSNSAQVLALGSKSEPFRIQAGVLQGSVLSPFLYSIFIDDLAKLLLEMETIQVGRANFNSTFYADDIALFAKDGESLQNLLNICQQHALDNRYRFNVSKCAQIGPLDCRLTIGNETVPFVEQFTYLGVEMNMNGIMTKAYQQRRCDEAIRAASRMVGLGMNVGGFGIRIISNLYKSFVRSKLEASMCILQPIKKFDKPLISAQQLILSRMTFTGRNTNGTILRSLLSMPRMTQRRRWLRSRFVHRFHRLPPDHILQKCMDRPKSWMLKLSKDIYDPDVTRDDSFLEEIQIIHAETLEATGQQLKLYPSRKPAEFLRRPLARPLKRLIVLWVLKKFPARIPPLCAKCFLAPATQTHIAICGQIFASDFTNIEPRFRIEHALSQPSPNVFNISLAILNAIIACLPYMRLSNAFEAIEAFLLSTR